MADRWEAQYQFWSSFGVPAYEENSVPTEARDIYPRITYQAAVGGFGANIPVTGRIWTRSGSWLQADTLSDQIEASLSEGGVKADYDGGQIHITAEDTFSHPIGDPDDNMIKGKILSVVLRYS